MGSDVGIFDLCPSVDQEIDVLARTMWGEARGQGVRGLRAVAHVVMNRVRLGAAKKGAWWGDTIIGVCRKPYQFSCWNMNDPNREKLTMVTDHNPQFRLATAIAARVVKGIDSFDITRGATHYHRFDISPSWARKKTPTLRIGDHIFYDLSEEA